MEQPQYLIDTHVVIDYLSKRLPCAGMEIISSIIDTAPNVSIITKIEILSFNAPEEHYRLLTNFINDAIVLDLISNIVDISIGIRRKSKTKLPDAIIAATALFYDLVLISRNTADFKNIQGLKVADPHIL
jgi:predicted nucleic acid-binding protein